MDTSKFLKVSESLRQYRRAELTEYEPDIGENPIEALYVDPLPDDAVLKSIISNNTSFLVGRKGTGKSTIFARAQQVYRSDAKFLSVYIDVKSLNDLVSSSSVPFIETDETKAISKDAYNSHMLRKATLGHILAELIKEITIAADKMSLKDRWTGKKRTYLDLKSQFIELIEEVKTARLEINEIPILQKISRSSKKKDVQEKSSSSSKGLTLKGKIGPDGFDADLGGISSDNFDKTLEDKELYNEYSDIVYRSFPFEEILEQIQSLLNDAGLSKLVVFFDDFSELNFVSTKQRQ